MKILVLGSGGREHALAKTLLNEFNNVEVFPGNAGIFKNEELKPATLESTSSDDVSAYCINNKIDLVVIGPENLLADGIVDDLKKAGINAYGPSALAAKLESSKIFSKELMKEANVPTADFYVARNYDDAVSFIESNIFPINNGIVLKADGLAAGKGVVVTFEKDEALKTAFDFMKNSKISINTEQLLIEKCLIGKELSAFAICDGDNFEFLGTACDYKRVGDGDIGPNTGGMGCYTPRNWPGPVVEEKIKNLVIRPILKSMKDKGHAFVGTLFCGLMINNEDINVIEFNVRFGDPETQTILPLIEGDFSQLLLNACTGKIDNDSPVTSLKKLYSVHLVKSSGGYPSIDGTPMDLGHEINGQIQEDDHNHLFYAGVKKKNDNLINSGGRVLGVTALNETLEGARKLAYQKLKQVSFEGEHYRNDIAKIDK